MDKAIEVYLPKWASILYAALAIILIPWIAVLAEYLPTKHVARHWDALWVGFDIILLSSILISIYFILKRKVWVIVSASALATLLLVDAWFDILTARPGREQVQSIISGVIEVTLSILTFKLVYHIIHHSTPEKDLKVIMKNKLF